jgi:hypothetical protein
MREEIKLLIDYIENSSVTDPDLSDGEVLDQVVDKLKTIINP